MRILFAAGGTAGHINPALAIAEHIKQQNTTAKICFAGRKNGMEYKLVTQHGYEFYNIEVSGIQRSFTPKNIMRNIKAVWQLTFALPRAKSIIRQVKPDMVIGTGGYVCGPVVRAASQMGIKTAIHEQNAFPGVTNKLLAKGADIVLVAMPDAIERLGFPKKTTVVGNPVRPEVFAKTRHEARKALGIPEEQIMILSFGGSLGAQRVNEEVAKVAQWHSKNKNFVHYHATGSIEKEDFAKLATELEIDNTKHFVIKEYIQNMPEMLAAADLVICRAGALTLAEISAQGKASILIPSPNVAENHQYFNALQLQKIGAAIVIEEKDLTDDKLLNTVKELTKNQADLMEMGIKAKQLAQPNSLNKIYDLLMA